jgi:hypothetical protein
MASEYKSKYEIPKNSEKLNPAVGPKEYSGAFELDHFCCFYYFATLKMSLNSGIGRKLQIKFQTLFILVVRLGYTYQ